MDKKALLHKIKLKRVSLGMSQDDVAKAIGVNNSQYSKLERGDSDISLTHLLAISDCLGLTFADFEVNDQRLPEKGHAAPESMHNEIETLRNQIAALQTQIKNIIDTPTPKKDEPAIQSVEANIAEFINFLDENNPSDDELESFIKESFKALAKSAKKKK